MNKENSETHVFVAKTPEQFVYDDDGNLLSDGQFNYTWDCENRLIGAETLANLPSSVPRVKLEFAYDYMGRRVKKQSFTWSKPNKDWMATPFKEVTFIYDGWNMVREDIKEHRSPTGGGGGKGKGQGGGGLPDAGEFIYSTNYYIWGLDFSGSLQGAGGIGGLLASVRGGAGSPNTLLYTYDANGNVSELIGTVSTAGGSAGGGNGELGTVGHYEYSPFGETIVATGSEAQDNPFRFSTKYWDEETGLSYYGYRYYSPSLGRWLSRDPIGENGGLNLYGFVGNNPIERTDLLGRTWEECLNSAVIKLTISHSELNDASINGMVDISLNPRKCRCVCEYPRFKQKARESKGRLNAWSDTTEGTYLINGSWQDDNAGQEYYPHGVFLQYGANMFDSPGEVYPWQRFFGFLVELDTSAVCTKGEKAGSILGSRKWGLEVYAEIQVWPPTGDIILHKRVWPGIGNF